MSYEILTSLYSRAKVLDALFGRFYHAMSELNTAHNTHDSDAFTKSEEIFDHAEKIMEWCQTAIKLERHHFNSSELDGLSALNREMELNLLWMQGFYAANSSLQDIPYDGIVKSQACVGRIHDKIGLLRLKTSERIPHDFAVQP